MKPWKTAPRWMHAIYAALTAHYWLPCRLCGKNHGGHEENGYLDTGWFSGEAVCFKCAEKAEAINQLKYASCPYCRGQRRVPTLGGPYIDCPICLTDREVITKAENEMKGKKP